MTPPARKGTTSEPAAPRHIPAPVVRADVAFCPRCDAQLRIDRDEYTCLACGYEFLLEPRDIEIMRQAQRRPYRAAAALAAPIAAVPLGGGFVILAAAVAAAALVTLRGRRRRRRGGLLRR